jgi:hypothetical protein
MKYRKKPVVIEAIQFDGSNESADMICSWSEKNVWKQMDGSGKFLGRIYITTLEGTMSATERDYIIRGVKGEYYPCKPGIFEQTYEKAED